MNEKTEIRELAQLLNAAISLHQDNHKSEAEEKYNEVLLHEKVFQSLSENKAPGVQEQKTLVGTIFSQAYNNLGILRERERNFEEAISCYRTALDYAPGNVEAHTNLGRVFRKKNNLDEALKSMRRALEIEPKYLPAIVQLCKICYPLGKTEEAIEAVMLVEDRLETHIRLNVDYGRILEKAGRPLEAKERLEKALSLDPKHILAHLSMGGLNFQLGKYGEALKNYQAILKINPSHLQATTNIGLILQRMGRLDDAMNSYKAALSLDPGHQETMSFCAALMGGMGYYEEGLAIAQRILEMPKLEEQPLFNAQLTKAKCERCLGRPLEAIETLRVLQDGPVKKRESHRIYFEFGYCYDALGDEQRAFEYFHKANTSFLKENEVFWSEKHVQPDFIEENLDEDFTSYFDSAYTLKTNTDETPQVFIVGFLMSGVEALSTFLSHVPNFQLLEDSTIAIGLRRAMSKGKTPYPGCLKEMPEGEVREWAAQYLKLQNQFTPRVEGGIAVNVYPMNFLELPMILKLFPRAKFIFTTKHPADTVLNCYMKDFVANVSTINFSDLGEIAKIYASSMDIWARFKRDLSFAYIEVSYEDLVTNSTRELKKIIKFIDPKDATGALKSLDKAAVKKTAEKLIAENPPMRWARYKKHLKPALKIIEPYVKKLGY